MFTDELRARTRDSMERILRGVTEAHGASYELDYTVGFDPVVNDPALAALVREVVGPEQLTHVDPIMGGDDFSAYLGAVPGVYFFVGAGGSGAFPHHHPRFTIDEAAFPVGIETMSRSALAFLGSA
jgi:amidohydrolase